MKAKSKLTRALCRFILYDPMVFYKFVKHIKLQTYIDNRLEIFSKKNIRLSKVIHLQNSIPISKNDCFTALKYLYGNKFAAGYFKYIIQHALNLNK